MNAIASSVLRSEVFDIENPEVHIETVSDDVKVSASPDGKTYVEISGRSSASDIAEEFEIAAHGSKIDIRVRKRKGGFLQFLASRSHSVFVHVKLPSTAMLKMHVISGDIQIDQQLDRIDAEAISGDINVRQNPRGKCSLKTISGDIKSVATSGCQYELRSISGDISISVAEGLAVDVDGKSISGDLESEIALSFEDGATGDGTETVSITASTISGDFSLGRC